MLCELRSASIGEDARRRLIFVKAPACRRWQFAAVGGSAFSNSNTGGFLNRVSGADEPRFHAIRLSRPAPR
jgi:hypothetical protein